MLTDNEARARLAEILAEQESLLDQVESNGKKFTDRQQVRYDALDKEVGQLERQLKGKSQPEPIKPGIYGEAEPREATLTREQRVRDWARQNQDDYNPEYEGLSFAKLVRGMALGKWDDAEREQRVMAEGTGAAGGFTVPTPLAAEVIDLARAKMPVIAAGARTIPMTAQKLKMARWASDPTAAWHAESAAISDSTPTLEQVEFTARTLVAVVKSSRELVEDAQNLGDALRNSFAQAIALELTRVALRGSGTAPEPRGVLNQTGVAVNGLGTNGAAPTYNNLIDLGLAGPQNANFTPNAFIWHSRTGRTFGKLQDANNNPLTVPSIVAELSKFDTNMIPINLTVGTSTDCSEIYCGQFDELLIGMRTDFQLEVLKERYAADTLDVGFLAWLRADIQLAHGPAFSVITGVRP